MNRYFRVLPVLIGLGFHSQATALDDCRGFRAALNASASPGSAIQACEKTTDIEPVKRACLKRIHPEIDRTVYELRCETACASVEQDSDELMACQVIKANALKGRRIYEGVSDAALAAAKDRATRAATGKPPAQYWSAYVAELRALASSSTPGSNPTSSPATKLPPKNSCAELSEFVALAQRDSCLPKDSKKVHLTLDDGPDLATTPIALETLRKNGLSGTFFVQGHLLTGSSESTVARLRMIRKIRELGSTVASHNYVHLEHTQMEASKVVSYAARSRDAGVDTIVDGTPMERYLEPVYRLPYGDGQLRYRRDSNDPIRQAYLGAGFQHDLYWTVDTEDWRFAESDAEKAAFKSLPLEQQKAIRKQQREGILKNLMTGLCERGPGTVLFHDIHPGTVENLQSFIDAIRCAGYEFGDLDSQFSGGVKPWNNPDRRPKPVCDLGQETLPIDENSSPLREMREVE